VVPLPQKLRKNRPQAAKADETVCSTIDSKRLVLVAQALSPAAFDFSSASHGRGSERSLVLSTEVTEPRA
jgi:hypothetical protein